MTTPRTPATVTDGSFSSMSHLYVRMYSRINDGDQVVIMTIAPSGGGIRILVACRNGDCFESKILKEADFTKYKNSHSSTTSITWNTFFELLQKVFVDHSLEFSSSELRLNIKHERHTDAFPMAPFATSLSIPLAKASNATNAIPEWAVGMMAYIGLRTGDKKEQDRIEEIAKDAKELEDEAVLVDRECALLEETVLALEQEYDKLQRESDDLGGQLDRSSLTDWRAAIDHAPLDRVTVRAYNPKKNQDGEGVEYNKRILRQIKNTWLKRMPKPRPQAVDLSPTAQSFCFSSNYSPPSGSSSSLSDSARKYSMATLRSSDALTDTESDANEGAIKSGEKKLVDLLEKIDLWEFSPSDFDELSKRCEPHRHGVLFYLSFLAFERFGLMGLFNLSEQKVIDWLSAVEAGYRRDAPYHNHHHAAMTLQSAMFILLNGEFAAIAGRCLPDFGILGLVMACIISAYDHPGVSNHALNQLNSYASCVYGKQSVTQSHSAAAALELMKTQRFDFLDAFTPQKKQDLLSLVQTLVISTDLARHENFMAFIAERGDLTAPSTVQASNPPPLGNNEPSRAPDSNGPSDPLLDDATAVLTLVIKAADVAYATKNTYQYREASKCYYAELKNDAVALERAGIAAELPTNEVIQLNLLAHVVSPLYSILGEYCPAMRFIGDEISSNRQLWRGS